MASKASHTHKTLDEILSTFNPRKKKMKNDKGHLRKSHQHRNDLTGEYVFGDMGQLILLVVFLVVCIADSFVFKYSTL
jgi:hypothetical protein